MKISRISLALALAFAGLNGASAQTYSVGWSSLSVTVPDGDLNGVANTLNVSGVGGSVSHITVNLNLAGGFNGDLYAYLYHDGYSAILLNRVGTSASNSVGYSDAGFGPNATGNSFTLDDQAAHDVHLYRSFGDTLNGSGQVTGVWQPDGRAIASLSAGSAFDSASRTALLSGFNGLDPNGAWTLYVADVSSGGISTLTGWGLSIQVPEPSSLTLLGLGALGGLLWRRQGCSTT